jgi:hypothetical protein
LRFLVIRIAFQRRAIAAVIVAGAGRAAIAAVGIAALGLRFAAQAGFIRLFLIGPATS